jgi:mannosyltransferase
MPPDEHSAPPLVTSLQPGSALTRGSALARWQLLSLAAITALAAFLRLWQAGESLWIDELHTSWVVSGSLRDVLPRAALGNQSPLYFWGMWLLVQVTGQSEWTLRLPSLFAGIALPAAVFYLVGQIFNLPYGTRSVPTTIAALAAALLIAIDPTCIFYSQEARPYAWVMLLAVVELVLLKRLIERPTMERRLALVANSLVLFYLHYTTAIFLGGIVVMLPMLVRVTGSAYPTRCLVLDLLLAAALAALGVIQMTDIFERRTNWEAFVQEPSWQMLFTEVPFAVWALVGAVVVTLALLVPRFLPGNAPTRGSASAAPPKTLPPAVLWYFALLASILIPLVLSWSITALDAARIYHIRYLVALVPLSAAAACLASAWISWRVGQITVLVLVLGLHLVQQVDRHEGYFVARGEGWRQAIEYLNNRLPSSSAGLVIVDSDLIEIPSKQRSDSKSSLSEDLQYLSFPLRAGYRLAVSPEIISVFPDVMHAGRIATSWEPRTGPRDVWAVIRGTNERAKQRISFLQQQAPFIVLAPNGGASLTETEHRQFGRIHVVRFRCTIKSS